MLKRISIFFLRISMGGLFFYAGFTKIMDPEWSAEGYIAGAKTFAPFFQWLALPSHIAWVNYANEWGLALIGASLFIGLFVRWSSLAGVVLMLLYYFPILMFPSAGGHSYIADEHIIYMFIFILFIGVKAGTIWGFDGLWDSSD